MTIGAARKLDAKVAERVMGWLRLAAVCRGNNCVVLSPDRARVYITHTRSQRDPGSWEDTTLPVTDDSLVPRYSTDLNAAWAVVVQMQQPKPRYWDWEAYSIADPLRCGFHFQSGGRVRGKGEGDTLAHAICLAALQSVEEEN